MTAGKSLTIAMDYDGTYTTDPDLWQSVIDAVKARGHTVYIVTARHREELANMPDTGCPIIPTGRRGKQAFVQAGGVEIDIWIDDDPAHILADHRGVR